MQVAVMRAGTCTAQPIIQVMQQAVPVFDCRRAQCRRQTCLLTVQTLLQGMQLLPQVGLVQLCIELILQCGLLCQRVLATLFYV